jgi:prephenate dehydratase
MLDKKIILALGPEGTNGHEAAQLAAKKFGWDNTEIVFCDRNVDLLKKLSSGDEEDSRRAMAVVPIENGQSGLVVETMHGFWLKQEDDSHLPKVIGEIRLPIEHCLLVKPGTKFQNIKKVVSHPQALAQCAQYLEKNGLLVKEPYASTAGAAKLVSESDGTMAAIASVFAGEIYGLEILSRNIADYPENVTCFLVFVRPQDMPMVDKTVPDFSYNTAVVFWLKDEPGSLYHALGAINSAGSNMSSIHSIPLGQPGTYAFYAEFAGHASFGIGEAIVRLMRQSADKLIVLGSWRKNLK